ncbi:hypothetical protein DITRI_Ditri12bG0143300 [Diplodiscus trichospermus]
MAVRSAAKVAASPASLYVGDLHPDVSDGQLFDAFSEFRSLASVRVCRDSSTGDLFVMATSTSFLLRMALLVGCFLNSHHAIEAKNHTLLNGKTIRVMWSLRDPDARKSGVGNVFVKNLSESIDNMGLQELFGKFGNVISCKVATFEDGKSKRYGFVQFDSEESANAAIEKLNDTTIGDKQIYVGKFIKKSDRVLPGPDVKYTNLYIKNLDPDITEELLQEKFSEFGKIASLVVAKDETGSSRGFGFVNFDGPNDAKWAMEVMNGSELGSKFLYVARAQKKTEREKILHNQFGERREEQIMKYKALNVYVKNIDDDVTEEEIREHFSQCGRITSAKLIRDDKGVNKGFGFVCFSAPEGAAKAVSIFHGYMFHRKPLYVAIAQRKEDRQAQLQLQYVQCLAGFLGPSTAVLPGAYSPLYYSAPAGVVSQLSPQLGMKYRPFGLRLGWRANGFAPPIRPTFQKSSLPVVPSAPRETRQNRVRMNKHALLQGGSHSILNVPQLQQPSQTIASSKDQKGASAFPQAASDSVAALSQGSEMLSSMLAASSPEQQKTILGERLYPLIQKSKPDLVPKITGMLLEMDKSELLLLLESPESLAAKVEEAAEVLELSNYKVPGQDALHPSFLSAGVAVN